MSGYDPKTDGSFGIWWTKWMMVGFFIAIGFCVYPCHLANVRMEEDLPSKHQGARPDDVTTLSRP